MFIAETQFLCLTVPFNLALTNSNDSDVAATTLSNVYVFPLNQLKLVLDRTRPLLNKFGGVCCVSDAIDKTCGLIPGAGKQSR